ncbi:MAG TPA: alkaline phosphatase family protein [Kofleriaceae bacterium]
MAMNRREALKTIGGLAGAATLGKFLPGCNGDSGGPEGIKNYVFLMLENRTYDHVFGARSWKEGKPGNGLTDTMRQPDSNNMPVAPYEPMNLAAQMCVSNDPHHSWGSSRGQFNAGALDGFLTVHQADYPGALEPMQYLTRKQQPISWALADAYTSCDKWHCSLMGPTLPNRFYWHAGTSAGYRTNAVATNNDRALDVDTIYHRLQTKNVPWRYYYGNLPVISVANSRLAPARQFTNEYLMESVKNFGDSEFAEGQFFKDAKEGKLAPVSYIDPAFYVNDDHPPTHPILAQALIASIYTALATSPQWKNCMLVITYDEHGGFYDHVAPPNLDASADDTAARFPVDENGATTAGANEFTQLGFRVPAMVIGPYVKQGYISSVQYDHTSALKHLENTFGLDPLTARVTAATDLSDCIDMDRLAAGDWAEPIQMPEFQFEHDGTGEITSVAVAGETWPYTKSICAPGVGGFSADRSHCPMNDAAIKRPEIFKGFDLRSSEGLYLDSITRFLAENQKKIGS